MNEKQKKLKEIFLQANTQIQNIVHRYYGKSRDRPIKNKE